MIKKDYQLTKDGKLELENELDELIGQRGVIASKIATARDFGDLSENAEYSAAKDEQSQVETRIAEIESILKHATIIKGGKGTKVGIGSTVEMKTEGKTVTYTIVGSVEADPLEGKISNESPIGSALIGKKISDKITITTPKGKMEYEITNLS
ncbi:transcription elongation factor GreA [Candidatus Saccharibacteria bacterium]|nr:transcription elongation factor GreA [Candidatus Saccharibacteria bacterium]